MEVIKDCLIFLKNNDSNYKQHKKFGIIIDNFVHNAYIGEDYLFFKHKKKNCLKKGLFFK